MAVNEPQAPEDKDEARVIPEFESALQRKSASFPQLVMSMHGMNPKFNENETNRSLCERYCSDLLQAFEESQGAIKNMYNCANSYGFAVAQTVDDKLFVTTGDANATILQFVYRCESIAVEAHRLLEDKDLEFCIDTLYSLVTDFYNFIDGLKPIERTKESLAETIHFLEGELETVKEHFTRSAQRRARIEYFKGMLIGLIIVFVEALSLNYAFTRLSITGMASPTIIGSLITGGVGALVSVMSRMSTGELQLDHDAGHSQMLWFGAFRPIIGSILGVIVYVLMLSEILPIKLPGEASTLLYFSLCVGFIAGFTERWAKDMLGLAQSRISTNSNREQQSSDDDK